MRTIKHLVLALAIAVTAFTGTAHADSAAVTNYKQKAQRIVDTWDHQMAHFNGELDKAKADLDALNKQSPPPADLDKQVAAIQANIKNIQASMDLATNLMRADLGLLELETKDKNDAIPLPGFVRDIIKAKGIPVAKNVSVMPNATWNWKKNTLGSASITVTLTFK